jgi:hypothetical protein
MAISTSKSVSFDAKVVAYGLGWFSLALGLTELLFARGLARRPQRLPGGSGARRGARLDGGQRHAHAGRAAAADAALGKVCTSPGVCDGSISVTLLGVESDAR